MAVYIYALAHPETGEIRYVGKSVAPEKRLRGHIGAARRGEYNHHTSRWVRKLLDSGLEPEMKVLAEVAPGQDWREVERKFIADLEQAGVRLTNSTAGGEGLDYRNPEDKARYIANLTASMRARAQTPEGYASLQPMMAKAHLPETRRKRAASLREFYQDPGNRERCAEINRETRNRPEVLVKVSEASVAMWKNPEIRAKFEAANARPEVTQKKSEAKKRKWADPEWAAQARERLSSPERRAKLSKSFSEHRADPAYRKKFSDITSAVWADPEKREALMAGVAALHADPVRSKARLDKIKAKNAESWGDPVKRAARIEKLRATRAAKKLSAQTQPGL